MTVTPASSTKMAIGANTIVNILSIKQSRTRDKGDNTGLTGAVVDEVPVMTLKHWSYDITGNYDHGDTNGQLALENAYDAGTVVAVRFYVDASHYWGGNAFVESYDVGAENSAGLVTCSFKLIGSGALTYT